MKRYEKMSKSRGNGISVDEVVYGTYAVNDGYEFRDIHGHIVDWKRLGVWRDVPDTQLFFTSTAHGRKPVNLCETGNPSPCVLAVDGRELDQHKECLR